ncbi:hypothetical protein MASR2M78_06300 [Treponema sp.]
MVERVHLVFKTHLDIGFTDLAEAVTERYLKYYIPEVITTANLLRQRGGRERLVWTTGSWLIASYLDSASALDRARLEEAIVAGDIVWHALPFTTHTELMDEALCDFGLSLSADLDKRFGRRTIAGKLTDVPGHTLGLVPLLSKRGVEYLHIGVNGGSRVPVLPPLFRWRAPSGEQVLVHYDAGYGSMYATDGMSDALVIVNGQDNQGPPKLDELVAIYQRISETYPGAHILASTLDAFAAALSSQANSFPLVESEIGDTWIHGVGSDPLKVSRYRALLRLRSRWVAEGRLNPSSMAYQSFMRSILMVPEHTWGLDFKKYLADYKNWSADDFALARRRDLVGLDAVPEEFHFMEEFTQKEYGLLFADGAERRRKRTYSFFESSHAEQRAYLDTAVAALPQVLRSEVEAAMEGLSPKRSDKAALDRIGMDSLSLKQGNPVRFGPWTVSFASDGSISSLIGISENELAGSAGLGSYRYESFSPEDYDAWHQSYNRNMPDNAAWVLPDFGKPGLAAAIPRPEHRLCPPVLCSLWLLESTSSYTEVEAVLTSGADSPRGAPCNLVLRYRFYVDGTTLEISLDWFDKEAVRLPEALWLSFDIAAAPGSCRMIKLGLSLDPTDTVHGGARHIHAVEALNFSPLDNRDGDRSVIKMIPLDSPLVSFGERKLLRYEDRPASSAESVHFNLYNNIWGTNFPLWYGQDGRSRFRIVF